MPPVGNRLWRAIWRQCRCTGTKLGPPIELTLGFDVYLAMALPVWKLTGPAGASVIEALWLRMALQTCLGLWKARRQSSEALGLWKAQNKYSSFERPEFNLAEALEGPN